MMKEARDMLLPKSILLFIVFYDKIWLSKTLIKYTSTLNLILVKNISIVTSYESFPCKSSIQLFIPFDCKFYTNCYFAGRRYIDRFQYWQVNWSSSDFSHKKEEISLLKIFEKENQFFIIHMIIRQDLLSTISTSM